MLVTGAHLDSRRPQHDWPAMQRASDLADHDHRRIRGREQLKRTADVSRAPGRRAAGPNRPAPAHPPRRLRRNHRLRPPLRPLRQAGQGRRDRAPPVVAALVSSSCPWLPRRPHCRFLAARSGRPCMSHFPRADMPDVAEDVQPGWSCAGQARSSAEQVGMIPRTAATHDSQGRHARDPHAVRLPRRRRWPADHPCRRVREALARPASTTTR
jgi:hypothetical protein